MSTFENQIVTCPQCAHGNHLSIATSINAERTPSAREGILAGTFQCFHCIACQAPFTVATPLVYLDFSRHQLFAMFPRSQENAWWEVEATSKQVFEDCLGAGAPAIARKFGEGMQVRTVFGFGAMREKLLLEEAAIDDLTFEAYKLDLMRSVEGLGIAPNLRPRLAECTAQALIFVVPALADTGGHATELLELPLADYEAFAQAYTGHDELRKALQDSAYVDIGRLLIPPP